MATQLFTKDMNRESVKILYLAAELLGSISKKKQSTNHRATNIWWYEMILNGRAESRTSSQASTRGTCN